MLNIREKRKVMGLTQKQLAECLNVSVGTVQNWEHGSHSPEKKYGPRLAKVFGCPENELWSETEARAAQFRAVKNLERVHERMRPITERRMELKLSRRELSKRSKITVITIHNLENGIDKKPRFETIQALRKAVGLPPEETLPLEQRNEIFLKIAPVIPKIIQHHRSALYAVRADLDDVRQDLALCAIRALERYQPAVFEISPEGFAIVTMRKYILTIIREIKRRGFAGTYSKYLNRLTVFSFESMRDAGFQFSDDLHGEIVLL